MTDHRHPAVRSPEPGPGPQAPVTIDSAAVLPGATDAARHEFEEALYGYAERLARESETQEISLRPAGSRFSEVSANSVVRARVVLDRYGDRAKPRPLDTVALVGVPLLSGGAGVLGGYLHSPVQWAIFAVVAFLAITCVFLLAARRLL